MSKDVIFDNVTVCYGDRYIYRNFSHKFEDGKLHVILGKSGIGKTTLLNVVANLVEYTGNCYDGKVSYVFQDSRLAPVSVLENVKAVLRRNYKDNDKRNGVAMQYLTLAEIADKAKAMPNTLSGGERQRVSLARAFAVQTDVLLMDEPFKSLDYSTKGKLYVTLDSLLQNNSPTTLFVTHDVDEALALADKIYVVQDNPCVVTEIATLTQSRSKRNLYSDEFVALRKRLTELL